MASLCGRYFSTYFNSQLESDKFVEEEEDDGPKLRWRRPEDKKVTWIFKGSARAEGR